MPPAKPRVTKPKPRKTAPSKKHWVTVFGEKPFEIPVEISETPEGFSLGTFCVEPERRQTYATLEEAESHVDELYQIAQNLIDATNAVEQWKAPRPEAPPQPPQPPPPNRTARRAKGERGPVRPTPTLALPPRPTIGAPAPITELP